MILEPDATIALPASAAMHTGGEAPGQLAVNPQLPSQVIQTKAVTQIEIGTTVYDLQSNSSVQNRTLYHADGTTAAAFTRGQDNPSFPDRGAGYNYHDGTNWGPQPTTRVETTRNGWPSLLQTGNGSEVIISHSGSGPFTVNKRNPKGTGA